MFNDKGGTKFDNLLNIIGNDRNFEIYQKHFINYI